MKRPRREQLINAANRMIALYRGAARVFWKETYELYQKPISSIALLVISILVVWMSGQINVRQPKIGIFLYTKGATDETLAGARQVLKEFAQTAITEVDDVLVDVNAMQRQGASLAIVFRDDSWLVLHRFATARQEAEAAQLAGMVAYALRAGRPLSTLLVQPDASKLNVQLYSKGVDRDEVERVEAILKSVPTVKFEEIKEDTPDLAQMEQRGANIILIRSGDEWFYLQRFSSAVKAAGAGPTVGMLGYLLKPGTDNEFQPEWSRLLMPSQQGWTSRLSGLPGAPQLELVPRTIALIIVFLPFVLAARSFSREVAFGTLPLLVGLPNGGWTSMAAGKVAACVWMVTALLILLLLAAFPMFDFSPKPGLATLLMVQGLAILTSACLGLLCAIQARNQMHIYLIIAVYFLVLVLVSGFLFPLETAAPVIQIVSFLSPLTFSAKVLESWMFFGTHPLIFMYEVLLLLCQAVAAVASLNVSMAFVRSRI